MDKLLKLAKKEEGTAEESSLFNKQGFEIIKLVWLKSIRSVNWLEDIAESKIEWDSEQEELANSAIKKLNN